MQNPKKLKVREEALRIASQTYRLTAGFPNHECFALASQMQRAAVSVGSNISEGCGGHGDRAFLAYLHRATGSLNELEFQLEVAVDLGYVGTDQCGTLLSQLRTTRRMIVRLMMVLRKRSQSSP